MAQETLNETDAPELTVASALEVLRWERGRITVRVLADEPVGQPIEFGDVAKKVARHETGDDAPGERALKHAFTGLYQTQFPNLEACGAITVDEDAGDERSVVIPQRELRTLADILACIDTHVDRRQRGRRRSVIGRLTDAVRRRRSASS
jgi:hypothetical protein